MTNTTRVQATWKPLAAAILLFAAILLSATANAQSSSAQAPALLVGGSPVELAIRSVSSNTVRISLSPLDERGVAEPLPDEPVLVARSWPEPLFKLRSQVEGSTQIAAGRLSVNLSASPLRVQVQGPRGGASQQIQIDPETGAVSFSLGDKPLFGLGQGGPQYDRRGHDYPMTNDHGAYRLRTHGGRMPVPWIVSPAGWAMFFHQPLGRIDLSGRQGKFSPQPERPTLPLDLFVTIGEPAELMTEYAKLTGYPSMPPLWTFGYQQSHRTLKDFEEVLWVAKTFREKKLPCDVLIYLGTGWCPSGWNTGHDSFEFNPRVFSDPAAQIRRLKDLDFRVVLHSTYPPPRLYGSVGDKTLEADDQSAAYYWRRHLPVLRLGIDGWWPDAAEDLPVESRLARIRMYWEGPQQEHPNERPYALHRTGYAGMQRIGGWLWSGDVDSTWETLQNHLPLALNTSMSGVPFWGTDIGGFYPTEEYTAEYFVRWFQFMSFAPLFRSHGRTWYTRLPWGWNTGVLGPDEMEHTKEGRTAVHVEQLHNPLVEPICRKYLELRYRLMPYIYTLARETHDTGVPMIRPLWLHYADDRKAIENSNEYLWGRDLLVAPVVEKAATSRKLYLPQGVWYDFWTGAALEGGREIEREVDLETTPLYVRQGAILPMGPVKQFTAEKVDGPLELTVYTGADGEASVYEDDGTSFDFANGEWMRLLCRWDDGQRRLSLALDEGSQLLPPAPRTIEVRLAPSGERRTVVFRGEATTISF